jgi:protein TonB
VREVAPSYPKLASMAHIAGTVRLKAVIGRDGTVEDLTLISGHPLLIQAAEAAVKQWIYKPTLLNGVPVEVETEIAVHFVAS